MIPVRSIRGALCAASLVAAACARPAGPHTPVPAEARAEPPSATYLVYVGAESADLLHRIRFGPGGAAVDTTIPVGLYAAEMEGPHGLAISADGRFLHMTTGHGVPDGMYWRIALGPDTVAGEPLPLGPFPATIDVTPDGLYAFVVNFNLHGEMIPSTVSVIYTPDAVEVARVETCTMPHGSRVGPLGTRHYSACMMDDVVVELDTRTFEVSRRFSVAPHRAPAGGARHEPTCSPTWVQPSPAGDRLYVACNRSDEILEIDTGSWTLARRFPTGRGPYNLAVTPDGTRLLATLKQAAGVQIFDLATGAALATIPTSTTLPHGVVISPDSRYAFISVEGVGAEPGRVDIIDVAAHARVASVETGQQASGIAFWKMERE